MSNKIKHEHIQFESRGILRVWVIFSCPDDEFNFLIELGLVVLDAGVIAMVIVVVMMVVMIMMMVVELLLLLVVIICGGFYALPLHMCIYVYVCV